MDVPAKPALCKTLLAFAAIYIIWGSTFLAIRIGVQQVPPLLFAAMRFFTAGLLLFLWVLARREPLPTRRQFASVFTLATLIFLCNYGLLFWAERRVPSGLAAVLLAMIPAFTAVAEILILRTRRMTLPLVAALLFGIAGVGVLTAPAHTSKDLAIDKLGAAALILSAGFWSVASALSRKLPLPPSKLMSSATQMLTGGTLLLIVATASGQLHHFHPAQVTSAAWLALLYLISAGSLLAFSAYVWLIGHHAPTTVGSYAYVNPIIAVGLGYLLAGEPLGSRTLAGTALILVAVAMITLIPATRPRPT